MWNIFYTELTTGLRRGEICGLMWRDFDENAGTLKILRSVNVPKRGEMEIGETKTERGRRTIRLPPQYCPAIKGEEKTRNQSVDLPGTTGSGETGASQRRLLLDEGTAERGGTASHQVP